MSNLVGLLVERGERYGNYLDQTTIIKEFKMSFDKVMQDRRITLAPDQEDAINMIIVKLSRILNGDPDYPDNWTDIAGYATLVADRLNNKQ